MTAAEVASLQQREALPLETQIALGLARIDGHAPVRFALLWRFLYRWRGVRPRIIERAAQEAKLAGQSWGSFVAAAFVGDDEGSGIRYRKASIRDARPFEFAWEDRILLDYPNLLVGIEGIGKGTLVAWILAHLTRGTLAGSLSGQPCNVGVIGDEDSFENTWIPRIYAAGGDTERVLLLESVSDGSAIDIKRDAKRIQKFTRNLETRVLYFDQLLDNIGYADSWKDQQVRNALAPIRKVLQAEHIALLATLHPNKRRGSFRDMLSGTPAFNAISRSSLLVARHPFASDRVVAVRPKGNYNKEPPAFEFAIESHNFYTPRRGRTRHLIKTNRICDECENTQITKDDVLDHAAGGRLRPDSKAGIARAALKQLFADGQTRPVAAVLEELRSLHGLDDRIVSRAALELGFQKSRTSTFPTTWLWSPNGDSPEND
jgi:AAA domain